MDFSTLRTMNSTSQNKNNINTNTNNNMYSNAIDHMMKSS